MSLVCFTHIQKRRKKEATVCYYQRRYVVLSRVDSKLQQLKTIKGMKTSGELKTVEFPWLLKHRK